VTETMVSPADSASLTYSVVVLDTAVGGNEAPEFTMESYTFSITENVVNGFQVGNLSVSDNDGTYIAITICMYVCIYSTCSTTIMSVICL